MRYLLILTMASALVLVGCQRDEPDEPEWNDEAA